MGEASFAIRRKRGGRDRASPGPPRQCLLLPRRDPARAGSASARPVPSARASGRLLRSWRRRPRGPPSGVQCPAGQARGKEDAGSAPESPGGRAGSGPGRAQGVCGLLAAAPGRSTGPGVLGGAACHRARAGGQSAVRVSPWPLSKSPPRFGEISSVIWVTGAICSGRATVRGRS